MTAHGYEQRARELQERVLGELIGGADLEDLVADLARSEDRRHPHPAEPLVELAALALALALAGASRSHPVPYDGLRERYLPEVAFSGRAEHRNSQYMLYAAGALRGGVEPDLSPGYRMVAGAAVEVRALRLGDLPMGCGRTHRRRGRVPRAHAAQPARQLSAEGSHNVGTSAGTPCGQRLHVERRSAYR